MEVHKNYFSPYMAALSHNFAELMPGDLKYSFFLILVRKQLRVL